MHRLAADVGGTFIDLVAIDAETGEMTLEKAPARERSLVDEFLQGMARMGVSGADVERLFHGTTVGTNTLVQHRGARVGLVTTAGFRDVLAIGRGGRPAIYDWRYAPPAALVEADLRLEVNERMTADGAVAEPISVEDMERVTRRLGELQVEAVAICFLNSYANPEHENLARKVVQATLPDVPVTVSHEISAEWHEYERTSSAAINAYLQPRFSNYLGNLSKGVEADGFTSPIAIMQSNGGVLALDRSSKYPIRSINSGPAGGVVAARALALRMGLEDVVCTDVGGTTYDVSLIVNGEIQQRSVSEIAGRPVLGQAIDIRSIGAGGGSVAWVDQAKSLRVGPQSAGAEPGPACFQRGGDDPTVTDAQLLLGYLDPAAYLGGRMELSVEAARAAVRTKIAAPLGLTEDEAVEGIVRIAQMNMRNAIHAVTVGRGLDPRRFTVVAYGGGGGLFATAVADALDIRRVIVPAHSSLFSAMGIAASDYIETAAQTRVVRLADSETPSIIDTVSTLSSAVRQELSHYGFEADDVTIRLSADLRYAGQHHTLAVQISPEELHSEGWIDSVRSRFDEAHAVIYGPRDAPEGLELVTLRVHGVGSVPPIGVKAGESTAQRSETLAQTTREVLIDGQRAQVPVFDAGRLVSGETLEGPCIVSDWASTVLIRPGWVATADEEGNLMLTKGADSAWTPGVSEGEGA